MTDSNNSNQTQIRADLATGETRVAGTTAPAHSATDHSTQITRYSASHNHSAGFARARELVEQSHTGKGLLLKKRFLLEDVLGHGGMGTVYKTRDLRKVEAEDPNPYIATKVLNQDFKDHPDAFVTLQQETAKSQTLAHPNIVTVHDFDRDGDTLFMTMELLEGQPLDQLIKAQRNQGLPKEQVWKITRDLCAALAYAHQRQFIHADFKPGNIFVAPDGSAKVLDFGIARATNREAHKHKFDAGQLGALTPAYATVEMVKDEPLAFTDDVYALACVVYEMLAGRHPYNNRSALQALEHKMQAKRLEGLSSREWKALSRGLALVKSERYASVAQFSDALFPRRNPILLRGAIGLALVSLLGAGWFAYSQQQAQQKVRATIAEKVAAAQRCFAEENFDCAIEHSLVAANLDPENVIARQLLLSAQRANEQRASDEKINELIAEAKTCLQQQDLDCAALFLQKAEAIGAHSSQVVSFHEALSVARAQQAQTAAKKEQEISSALARAQTCLSGRDYSCVVNSAVRILELDPTNAQAVAIKQSASLAQEQASALTVKITRLMSDAQGCMDKKNYSCAIAKAESVLELDASYQAAVALKNRAQETQRKLKESGFTIK
ncbi:serine/threonine protein kinase [Cellvibrio sp. KY-GH-1]|uniref:serine/threonine-protein kinase n=1 Tax=Cellvibrio sp. KY-GH-1 TaxID=2303332 RepID=UPI0012476B60|nr:serine/threonine-protein kinase [Cellvibrio sp. KY-GH-1]QEY16621.1 serine/threonine protein kinase [Cellvibrio sp. KY-GH-1]